MRTVRIIDRGSAQQHGLVPVSSTGTQKRAEDDAGKPSVDEKRLYYWNGPGWIAAYTEARRLMDDAKLSAERAAAQVGWSREQLEEAIARDGKPPELQPGADDDFRPRERPRRTVKQRVAGLHGVSRETLDRARRYYEVEIMTVREVAKALGEPYEKTYLILIRAKTKFRRPGRRGAADAVAPKPALRAAERRVDARVVSFQPSRAVTRVIDIEPEPVVKPRASARPRAVSRPSKEEEKALRRVLGRVSSSDERAPREKQRVVKARQPRQPKSERGRGHGKRTEEEKALRRVLG